MNAEQVVEKILSDARAEAEKAEAETEKALWQKVDTLKKQVDQAEKRLADLKDAGAERVESLRDEISRLVA